MQIGSNSRRLRAGRCRCEIVLDSVCMTARLSCFATLVLFVAPIAVSAQIETDDEPQRVFPQADYAELGLHLPAGEVPKPGEGRRVVVPGLADEPEVAEVYLEFEDDLVVLLRNGYLKTVPKTRATRTERPFEPMSQSEIRDALLEKFQGFQSLTTARHVFIYNCSPTFANGTKRIINTMYRTLLRYCQRINPEADDPRFPLVMILFRSDEDFQKYQPMPPGLVAYYNMVSNHVIMYEQSALAEIAPELAIKQSISTIAHESVHQVLHNVGVQQRLSRWPTWVSEGLPEYFAPTSVTARASWKGIGESNNLRMHGLIRHLENESGNLGLEEAVKSKQMDGLDYARSWALIHYLGQRKPRKFLAMLRDIGESVKAGGVQPKPGFFYEKHFGSDYDELDELVLAHLRTLRYDDPIANQTHYVAIAETKSRRVGLSTTSPSQVVEWRRRLSQNGRRASLRFQVRAFPNRTTAEQFISRQFR